MDVLWKNLNTRRGLGGFQRMEDPEETIKYVPGGTKDAYFAVQYHVAIKGAQAGSLFGMVVLAPLVWRFVGRAKGRTLLSYVKSEATVGATGGALLSLGAGWAKLRDQSKESIADRAYRIKHNRGQQEVDYKSMVGALVFGGVGAIGFGKEGSLAFFFVCNSKKNQNMIRCQPSVGIRSRRSNGGRYWFSLLYGRTCILGVFEQRLGLYIANESINNLCSLDIVQIGEFLMQVLCGRKRMLITEVV